MIIKSTSRKTIRPRSLRFKNAFEEKLEYFNRDFQHETHTYTDADGSIYGTIYGRIEDTPNHIFHRLETRVNDLKRIEQEYMVNYEFHSKKRNRVVLFHEIISFPKDDRKTLLDQTHTITQIGKHWLNIRAPKSLGYGVFHTDKDHIHLHLLISGNLIGSSKSLRLSKREFREKQQELERFQQEKFPELSESRFYDYSYRKQPKSKDVLEKEMLQKEILSNGIVPKEHTESCNDRVQEPEGVIRIGKNNAGNITIEIPSGGELVNQIAVSPNNKGSRSERRGKNETSTRQKKERTKGLTSKKERIAKELRDIFQRGSTESTLHQNLSESGYTLYQRGKHFGVVHTVGMKKTKYRFATLGIDTDFKHFQQQWKEKEKAPKEIHLDR